MSHPYADYEQLAEREIKERGERIAALEAMLRELEWSGNNPDGDSVCPACRAIPVGKPGEHEADCRLAAILGAVD